MDLQKLWFYQRGTAKELINFSSRLIAGRIQPGQKATTTLEDGLGKCSCWTTSDGLSVSAITTMDYPEKAPFILINNMLLDFRETFAADPSVYENVAVDQKDGAFPYPAINEYFEKW